MCSNEVFVLPLVANEKLTILTTFTSAMMHALLVYCRCCSRFKLGLLDLVVFQNAAVKLNDKLVGQVLLTLFVFVYCAADSQS